MKCNLEPKGRRLRLVSGVIVIVIGLVLAVLGLLGVGRPAVMLAVAGGCLLGGGFQIFEARKGWCMVRAMGFKTPI